MLLNSATLDSRKQCNSRTNILRMLLLLLELFLLFKSVTCSSDERPTILVLVGSNLPPYTSYKWGPTGQLTEANGIIPAYLDLIAHRFRFDYSFVPLGRSYLIDDRPNEKGLISQLLENKGEVIIGQLIPTPSRFARVDFTQPITEYPSVMVIPQPSVSNDESSLIKPFGQEVWICLIASLVAVIVFWYLIGVASHTPSSGSRKQFGANRGNQWKNESLFTPIAYTITVLFGQGNHCPTKQVSIRLIALVWCLATFVLAPAYSGKLISFIMSPVQMPIVETLNDVANKAPSGLKVAVDRGLGSDVQLQQWATLALAGSVDTVGKMALATYKTVYRCNRTEFCTEKVLEGGHVLFIGKPHGSQAIADDLKRSGKCRLTFAKARFNQGYQYWALPKRSPLFKVFNRGILEIHEYGLTNYWESNFIEKPVRCLSRKTEQKTRQITLVDLTSTFILLSLGCCLGLLSCLAELCIKTRTL